MRTTGKLASTQTRTEPVSLFISMAPFSIAKVWVKFELPTSGLGANLILTRPSFTNFPISVHESALDSSNMTSPFCSVQRSRPNRHSRLAWNRSHLCPTFSKPHRYWPPN